MKRSSEIVAACKGSATTCVLMGLGCDRFVLLEVGRLMDC